MRPRTFPIAAALALTLAGSLPADAQTKSRAVKAGPTQVIALQSRVESLDNRGRKTGRVDEMYGIKSPDEAIPISVGERLRVHLVGTGLVNGSGVEVPVNASFSLAAGKDNLHIVQAGSNWVIVEARGRGDKVAQLAYTVNGNYDMKPGLASGRLSFEINSNGLGQSGPVTGGNVDRDRWERARVLTDQLYQGILDQRLGGQYADEDVEHVYDLGFRGVRDVALELARQRDERNLSQSQAQAWVADLYRTLLRRTQNESEMWNQDEGFRGNVDSLRRNGLERVVQTIVDSEEFRSANDLASFDRLAVRGRSESSWRGYRPRSY